MQELTPQQLAKLDAYVDEDAAKQPKFRWDDLFQRKILGLLLCDKFFLVQSLDKVQSSYFSNEAHVLIAKSLFKHFEKYKALPEKWFLWQGIADQLAGKDDAVKLYYQAELQALYEYYVPGLDTREALLDRITNFAKVQALKLAFHKCLEMTSEKPDEEETWIGKDGVYDLLRRAMSVEKNYDVGLEYFLDPEEMFRRMRKQQELGEKFTSGFPQIDNALTGGTPMRGQIFSWIGTSGVGKSLACCRTAVENIKLGHKCLYISMEMDEVSIAQRFTAMFCNTHINYLLDNQNDILETIGSFTKDKDNPNMLIVKQFPGGVADVNTIRAYMSQLEIYGFVPDVLIIDYVGEMKMMPGIKTWESMYLIVRDLRGFAVEKQVVVFTAAQPNKTASELTIHEYIDESNIGGSFDQWKPLDGFWSLNQTVLEKEQEIGRCFVIKHRHGRSRFAFKLGFDYNQGTLNITEISDDNYNVRLSMAIEKKAATVKIDSVKPRHSSKKRGFEPNPIIDPVEGET